MEVFQLVSEESVSKTGGAGLGVKSGPRVILCRKGSQGCPETHAGPARAPAVEALPPFPSLPLAPPASHPLSWAALVTLLWAFVTAEVLAPDVSGSSLVI